MDKLQRKIKLKAIVQEIISCDKDLANEGNKNKIENEIKGLEKVLIDFDKYDEGITSEEGNHFVFKIKEIMGWDKERRI